MADTTTPIVTGTVLAEPTAQTSAQNVSPETAQENQAEAEPKYVTQADLERRDAELIRRLKQSDRDRTKQIEAQLGDIKAYMETNGAQLNPQQEQAMRSRIETQIDGPVEEPQAAQASVPPEFAAQVQFLSAQMDEVFTDVGMKVTPNDVEWKVIQAALDDPKGSLAKTLRVTGKAAEAKASRMAVQQGNASARVISAGQNQSSGAVNAQSAKDLWSQAYKR